MTINFYLRLPENNISVRYLSLTSDQGRSLVESGDTGNLFVRGEGYQLFHPWAEDLAAIVTGPVVSQIVVDELHPVGWASV